MSGFGAYFCLTVSAYVHRIDSLSNLQREILLKYHQCICHPSLTSCTQALRSWRTTKSRSTLRSKRHQQHPSTCAFVERFCTITVPPNQNGSSKNLQLACNCCGKVFRGQLITALVHLAGARKGGQRISICPTPNEELKAEVLHLFSLDHVHSEDALNEEALHIGEHFHHPNMVDIQLQQQQHFMQANNKLTTARDRATAKRKRDYGKFVCSVVMLLDLCS